MLTIRKLNVDFFFPHSDSYWWQLFNGTFSPDTRSKECDFVTFTLLTKKKKVQEKVKAISLNAYKTIPKKCNVLYHSLSISQSEHLFSFSGYHFNIQLTNPNLQNQMWIYRVIFFGTCTSLDYLTEFPFHSNELSRLSATWVNSQSPFFTKPAEYQYMWFQHRETRGARYVSLPGVCLYFTG